MALKVLSALETSKITVPEPSDTTDATTKQYVDGSGGGGVTFGYNEWTPDGNYSSGSNVLYNGKIYTSTNGSPGTPGESGSGWTEITLSALQGVSSLGGKNGEINTGDGLSWNGNTLYAGICWTSSQTPYGPGVTVCYNDRLWVSLTACNRFAVEMPGNSQISGGSYPWTDYSSVQNFTEITASSSNTTLSNIKDNWLLLVGSTVTPGTFTLANLSAPATLVHSHEMIVRCEGSGTVTLSFSNVRFLDETNQVALERGYNHFLVFRNFPAKVEGTTITRQWVANVQGKVPIPTS